MFHPTIAAGEGARIVVAAIACQVWLLVGAARADEPRAPKTPDVRRKVERLVNELDAQTRSARVAAQQSLLDLGPAILPLLPDDRRIESAAVREAVGQIRARLERASALATLAVSRVNLHGKLPLRQIVAQISAQTGNELDVSAVPAVLLDREFRVDVESRPFWAACDGIIRRAGLGYGLMTRRGRLQLVPTSNRLLRDLSVENSGPFRVSVFSARLRESAGGQPRMLLRIGWTVTAEPRLRPLFATVAARDLSLRGGAVTLTPVSPSAKLDLSMGEGGEPLRLETDFEVPARPAPADVAFRGSLRVELAAGPQPVVFDRLEAAPGKTRKIGSVTVRLRDVNFRPNGKPGSARIEVGVVYDQGGRAFESYRGWIFRNEVRLESKTGRPILPEPIFATRQQGDGSIAVEYNFANVGTAAADYRFVYVAPTLIVDMPVAFDLPKIPTARPAEGAKR